MQALMLAAGKGSRLQEKTKNNTKCMLPVNDIKLIDRAIATLKEANIDKLILVVGYKRDNLMEYLGDEKNGVKIEYIVNELYDTTNSIYSFCLASDKMLEDDTILLESDLIFDSEVITSLATNGHPDSVVCAPFERWMDGTVLSVDNNDIVEQFIAKSSMNWSSIADIYKTVNIYKFSPKFMKDIYIPYLKAYVEIHGNNSYYEAVFSALPNVTNLELHAHILKNEKWYEIDDAQDYDIASIIFAPIEQKLKMLQHRFGGYWRFPNIVDFNLLVNPHFPTKEMYAEMQGSFEVLMSEYPSRQSIVNMLAAKMFKVSEDKILVANGSAEFINIGLDILDIKKMLIPYPTFNEYPNRTNAEIIRYHPSGFKTNVDEIIENAKEEKPEAILIISPDNPSGYHINYDEIIKLADFTKENDIIFIFDESFADFAEENRRFTLIDNGIMDKYQNMIIIKSIGKSYGVAGARIGVMSTSNNELISEIQKRLSIWNLNSFAEYFLQIIGKYQDEYIAGCNSIVKERNRMIEELRNIDFLKVYESQANYVLVEVIEKYTNEELAIKLLEDNIFIKVLEKEGLEKNKFIRLAIRDKKDNDMLISKLLRI